MGFETGGHIKCAHGSSPQLTLCTLKILNISCLQLYLSHPLTLWLFSPQTVSPLSHGKIGTADCQLIPVNLFICVEHHAILQCELKKKSSDAYVILLFLVLKKLLSWYSNSNPDDRKLYFKERQAEISHNWTSWAMLLGTYYNIFFCITPTLLNVQNAEQVIVLSATS